MNGLEGAVEVHSELCESGILKGWLVAHIHHVEVVSVGPIRVEGFVAHYEIETPDPEDVKTGPVEFGQVKAQHFSLHSLRHAHFRGVHIEISED